jgi:ATP-binding cassette subfamily B (MDR/TAP) protein 1
LNAIKVVAAFGQEKREEENYTRHLETSRKAGIKAHFKGGIVLGIFFTFILGCYSYGFFMGGIFIYKEIPNDFSGNTYTSGDVITIFFGIIFGVFSFGMAGTNIKAVSEGKAAAKMAFETIEREPPIKLDDPNSMKLELKGKIILKNIKFTYPSRDDLILDDVSAVFEPNQVTAIVGPSGSGKSTIVQLIERFYDPQEGQIIVDGHDLKNLNLRKYRHQVGYVGQEPVLFNKSIKENILYGKSDATDEEIISALKSSNAWEFVSKLIKGMDTNVGTSGG